MKFQMTLPIVSNNPDVRMVNNELSFTLLSFFFILFFWFFLLFWVAISFFLHLNLGKENKCDVTCHSHGTITVTSVSYLHDTMEQCRRF